jgi:hypothetical protein
MVAPLELAVPPSRAPMVVTALAPLQLLRVCRHTVSLELESAGIVRARALACEVEPWTLTVKLVPLLAITNLPLVVPATPRVNPPLPCIARDPASVVLPLSEVVPLTVNDPPTLVALLELPMAVVVEPEVFMLVIPLTVVEPVRVEFPVWVRVPLSVSPPLVVAKPVTPKVPLSVVGPVTARLELKLALAALNAPEALKLPVTLRA